MANTSEFLMGHNDRGWKADFDFIMRIDKATAILEGKYNTTKVAEISDWAKLWKEAKEESEQIGSSTNSVLPIQ